PGDVGSVVDGQQGPVFTTGVGQHLESRQLLSSLQRYPGGLVAQLQDVDTTRQGRFGELGEIAEPGSCVGTQVESSLRELRADLVCTEIRHRRERTGWDTVVVSAREPTEPG